MHVTIGIGPYIIKPQGNRPDGRVLIDVQRVDVADGHDHSVGQKVTIDIDGLFDNEQVEIVEPERDPKLWVWVDEGLKQWRRR